MQKRFLFLIVLAGLTACTTVQGAANPPAPTLAVCPTSVGADPADAEVCPVPGLEPKATAQPADTLETYVNADFGLEFAYPSGYAAGGACTFSESITPEGGLLIQLGAATTLRVEPAGEETLEEAVTAYTRENPGQGFEVTARSEDAIADVPVVTLQYRLGSLTQTGRAVLALYADHLYTLQTAPAELCAGEADVLDSVRIGVMR